MAKKVPITKVLSCFVVFVFLMSSLSVAVIATDSSNSTASTVTDNANTSSPDPINESVEVPDPNLPVLNDTDISTAKTVSSLGYCSYVWIEITDKYCKGYEVYVDGVYQFTEGEDSVPDGYCCFKVTPGYHTFKLTLNGKEVSKGWNCQCGTGYNWMSMNDMIPHWCEGGGNDNPTDEYEVKFRGTVTGTTPSEYDCGFKDVYICEVKIEKVVSGDYFEKGDIVNIVYSQWRENAHVCGTYDKVSVGDTVEVYGEMIPIYCVGTWITICGKSSYYLKKISSESLSISVWTDKSEYKIGETVTIYYQTNKKCTAKLTITKPDGGDIVYGPNEIPASTRSKSATAGYPTGKRTVVFEAWAGAEYKKATCYFEVVEEELVCDVTFEGTITEIYNKDNPHWYDAKIKVTKVIDDPSHTLDVNEIVNVYRANENAYEDAVSVGDLVEVCAEYNSKYYKDHGYALRDWQHHIKKMEVKTPVHNIDTGKDFATIQAAIDDSDTGHTITVDPGTYVENVDVTKSLTIKSTSGNPADTIVQAAVSNQNYQNVFTVSADNVNIDGFTIEGASYFWCSGILLNSNNCIISNNTFEGNAIGIWIHPPSLGNNIIRNNQFSSSSGYSPSTALYLEAANNKIYLNNFIIGMEWGSGNLWNSPTQITYEYAGNTFISHLGNYWDDYTDTDANGDGIWDHPYSIEEGIDYYPLVEPFENYVSVEEKPEIKFIGTYLYVFNPMGFNAYHFSVDKVLGGKDIAGDEAQIIISEVDETPEAIKELKEGDKVEIYGKVKNYYEGAWIIDIEGNGYYIKRLKERHSAYINYLSGVCPFYGNYSNIILDPTFWQNLEKEKMEGMTESLIRDVGTTTVTTAITTLYPAATATLGTLSTITFPLTIVLILINEGERETYSAIGDAIYYADPGQLRVLLITLQNNGEYLKTVINEENSYSKAALELRQWTILSAYEELCSFDQRFLNNLRDTTITNKASQYNFAQKYIAMLANELIVDYALTTIELNDLTGENEEVFLPKVSECELQSHCFQGIGGIRNCFGYFNSKEDTDKYEITTSPSVSYLYIYPASPGSWHLKVTYILKQAGEEVAQGNNNGGLWVSSPSGIYELDVKSEEGAGCYGFDIYGVNIKPIE